MNVVALLAHPDDELACAGTLARLRDEGHQVVLVTAFFSDYAADGTIEGRRTERLDELAACALTLGVSWLPICHPDESQFAWSQQWVQWFETIVGPAPDLLISHRAGDHNTSHGHLGRIAETLCRRNRTTLWQIDQPLPGGISGVAPNLHVDISDYRNVKARAVGCYRSQLARYPDLHRALEHRDALYGWQIGCEAAEGFTVAKAVW